MKDVGKSTDMKIPRTSHFYEVYDAPDSFTDNFTYSVKEACMLTMTYQGNEHLPEEGELVCVCQYKPHLYEDKDYAHIRLLKLVNGQWYDPYNNGGVNYGTVNDYDLWSKCVESLEVLVERIKYKQVKETSNGIFKLGDKVNGVEIIRLTPHRDTPHHSINIAGVGKDVNDNLYHFEDPCIIVFNDTPKDELDARWKRQFNPIKVDYT